MLIQAMTSHGACTISFHFGPVLNITMCTMSDLSVTTRVVSDGGTTSWTLSPALRPPRSVVNARSLIRQRRLSKRNHEAFVEAILLLRSTVEK